MSEKQEENMQIIYRLKIFSIFILTFFVLNNILAGTGTVQGKVYNKKGEVLVGANVEFKNHAQGTSTNKQGEFIFTEIPSGKYIIQVSYIGYEKQKRSFKLENGEEKYFEFDLEKSFIKSQTLIISGNPGASNPMESPKKVNYITGREKIRNQAVSLGKTLESMAGVDNISTGAVSGKPIIRGQSGERIKILNNGIGQEFQQYGTRHTPTLDPFNSRQIEVVQGPASLLYGSSALGGAINLLPYQYKFGENDELDFEGKFYNFYRSNNSQYNTGVKIQSGNKNFGIKGSIIYKKGGNFHTPDVETYPESGMSGDPKFAGEIDHTDFEQLNGSIGAGMLTDKGLLSLNYKRYCNENNFLLPDGGPIGIRHVNQVATLDGDINFDNFKIEPKLSYQRNRRLATRKGLSRQYLPDSANVDLVLNVYTGRFEVEHYDISGLSGTWGAEVKYYDHNNIGFVPLQPTGSYANIASFVFEEWRKNNLTLNFGTRFDYRKQTVKGNDSNPLLPQKNEYDSEKMFSISGAVGSAYQIDEKMTVAVNIGRGFRNPSFYNMYVHGYHGGVFAYQIGNPNLKSEKSLDISGSLRYKSELMEMSLNLYENRIKNYIYLRNVSKHKYAPSKSAPEYILVNSQANTVIEGLSVDIDIELTKRLNWKGNFSLIKSEFTNGGYEGQSLPKFPPTRINSKFKVELPQMEVMRSPYVFLEFEYNGSKNVAGVYEPFSQFDKGIGPDIPFGTASTDSYLLVNLGMGTDVEFFEKEAQLDINITNLLNRSYRDFLDTYKGYTLSPGRSVNVKITLPINN